MIRALRIFFTIVIVGVIALGTAAYLYSQTDSFRDFALDQIVAATDGALAGEVSAEALDGSIWSRLVLRGLTIRHDGHELVRLPSLTLQYSLASIVSGRLRIGLVELDGVIVRATQDNDGEWDLLKATATAEPSPEPVEDEQSSGGLPFAIDIASIHIVDGLIEVTPFSQDPRQFSLGRVNVESGLEIDADQLRAEIARLSTQLTSRDLPPVDLQSQLTYVQSTDRSSVTIDKIQLTTAQSKLTASGEMSDLDAQIFEARLTWALNDKELRSWVPTWPLHVKLDGNGKAQGSSGTIVGEVDLTAANASAKLNAQVNNSGAEPVFDAALRFERIEPAVLFALQDFAGSLSGNATAKGTGSDTATMVADLKVDGSDLAYAEMNFGNLTAEVALREERADIRANLSANGSAALTGSIHIADNRYDLALDINDFDVASVSADAAAAGGALNMTATVEGSGISPEQADARVAMDITPSKVGPVDIDSARLRASVAGADVRIAELVVHASDSTLNASGSLLDLTATPQADFDIDLRVSSLGPWMALADQRGSGALQLDAQVKGPTDHLGLSARADLSQLSAVGIKVGESQIRADLEGIGAAQPTGNILLSAKDLDLGTELSTLNLKAVIPPGDKPMADIDLDATTKDGLDQSLRARVEFDDPRLLVEVKDLSLGTPRGKWQLAAPARVVRDGQKIQVEDMRLSSAEQRLVAGGALSNDISDVLRIRIDNVSLESFADLASDSVEELAGMLEAEVEIRGPLDAIKPSGTVRLSSGRAKLLATGTTIEDIEFDTVMTPESVEVRRLSAKSGEGTIEATAVIALADYQPDGIEAKVTAKQWPAIDSNRYKAVVDADINASGSLDAPAVGGEISIYDANLRPDLDLPGNSGPPPRDKTIVVVQEEREREKAALAADASPVEDETENSEAFINTTIDMNVKVGPNVWVKNDDTSVELAGEVRVSKKSGNEDVRLVGDVDIVRGWILLYGRRFEPRNSTIRFTGGQEIDPTLDIQLVTRTREYTVTTVVGGTAAEPALSFESDPRLEEADVLAVIMFGKPVSDLGGGEQVALEQQAAEFASGYLASQVGQQLGDAFGFQISELDVIGGRVGVGRYLTPKTYVSIVQDIAGKAAREIRVDYYFNRSWTARTQSDSEGESGVDLFWQKKY